MSLITLGLMTLAATNDPQLIADAAFNPSVPDHDRAFCCAMIYEFGLKNGVRYLTPGTTQATYGSWAADWMRRTIGSKDEAVRRRQRQILEWVEPALFPHEVERIRVELAEIQS